MTTKVEREEKLHWKKINSLELIASKEEVQYKIIIDFPIFRLYARTNFKESFKYVNSLTSLQELKNQAENSYNLMLSEKEVTVSNTFKELGDGLAVRDNKVAAEGDNKFPLRYDLISPIIIRALAETYGEGAIKYGDNNWKKGFPEGNLLNHALAHIVAYMEGDTSEPHLEHALWNIGTQIHFDRQKKKN